MGVVGMEGLLRSHPNTAASLKYIVEEQRNLIDPSCLSDTHELTGRYGLALRYHPSPAPIPIDCLWITSYGRFGNLLMQMSHALDAAKHFGVPKIYFDTKVQEPDVFQEQRSCLIDGIEMYATTFAKPTEHQSVLYGIFWSLRGLMLPASPPPRDVVPSRHLIEVLSDEVRRPQPSERIVAHFRGGDIFSTSVPATYYAQPPVAFYTEAIRAALDADGGSVVLVYEDMSNPVVEPVIEWLKANAIPFRLQSGALKDDLRAMLAAETIVASYGTFVPGIMKLSSNIRRVYSFENDEVFGTWSRFRRDIVLQEYADRSRTYIKRGEWRAAPEQLAQMIAFSAEHIVPYAR